MRDMFKISRVTTGKITSTYKNLKMIVKCSSEYNFLQSLKYINLLPY